MSTIDEMKALLEKNFEEMPQFWDSDGFCFLNFRRNDCLRDLLKKRTLCSLENFSEGYFEKSTVTYEEFWDEVNKTKKSPKKNRPMKWTR